MAVIRQQRQTKIGPIGINRTFTGGDSLGDAIIDVSNQIGRRYREIAIGEAKERGAKAAAEADLPSITTLDEGTNLPIALKATEGMGRFSAEAFNNVILKRFENALSDDITSKKNELMQRLSESPNAPAKFEQVFQEYLNETGANASGYYKQIITDYGANAMEDGRSRLRVAQIAKIQAEAKAAKAKRKAEFNKLAFNQGAAAAGTMTFHQFFKNATNVKSEYSNYEGVGVATTGEYAGVFSEAQKSFAAGRLTAIMQDPDLAKEAQQIYTYFSTGGSQAILEILSPEAQDAVRSITAVSTADSPLDIIGIASDNASIFTQAQTAGDLFIQEEQEQRELIQAQIEAAQQETDALNKIAIQRRDALIQQQKDRATNTQAVFQSELNTDNYKSFGEHAQSMRQVDNVIADLNARAKGLQPTVIGSESFNKIQKDIKSAKNEINIGLLTRTLKGLTEEQVEALAVALGGGDKAVIGDLMSPLVFDRFMLSYTTDQYGRLQEIANDWRAGKKLITDANQANALLSLKSAKRQLTDFIKGTDSTHAAAQSAYDDFVSTFAGVKGVSKELESARSDLEAFLRTKKTDEDNRVYDSASSNNINQANLENIGTVIENIETLGQNNNQQPDKVIGDAEKALDNAVQQAVTTQSVVFGQDEFSIEQLRLMSEYARTGIAPDDLTPLATKIVQESLDREYTVMGSVIRPDNLALAETLSAAATSRLNAFKANTIAQEKISFKRMYLEGKPASNPTSSDQQAQLGTFLGEAAGYDGALPTDFFEKPVSEFTPNDITALNLIKNNTSIIPSQLVNTFNRLLTGSLSPESIPNVMTHLRETLFTQTENGKPVIAGGVIAGVGAQDAAKLEAIYRAYELAPAGNETLFYQQMMERLAKPLEVELFRDYTGYGSAGTLLKSLDVPSYLMDDLTPVVEAYVNIFESGAYKQIEQAIDNRFADNANGYSPWSGGSYVAYDVSLYTKDIKGFEKGVAEIAKTLVPNAYFDIGSGVSVEDIRAAANAPPTQILKDVFGNVTAEVTRLRQQERVLYGPTLSATQQNPVYQLYTMDEFGFISVVPDSQFNLATEEIARAMGTYVEKRPTPPPAALQETPDISADPTAPSRTTAPTSTVISEDVIRSQLSEDQKSELESQIERRSKIGALKYPPMPTEPIIMPSQELIKRVGSIAGSKSEAALIMQGFNTLPSAPRMRTEITRTINLVEDLPKTKGRDDVLQQLYAIRNSLQGKRNLNE